jgi:acetyl esterase/lipase
MSFVAFSTDFPPSEPRHTEGGIPYRLISDVSYLEPERKQQMDVYLPGKSYQTHHPTVLIIHGGGWAIGGKDQPRERAFAEFMVEQGYIAASIGYTLAEFEGKPWSTPLVRPGWPDNLYDAKSALRFLRRHHEPLEVDPAKIAVLGSSAGGHLALLVGLTAEHEALNEGGLYHEQDNHVCGVVNFYGIPDVRVWGGKYFTTTMDLEEKNATLSLASPVEHLHPDIPPILTVHGDADSIVDVSISREFDALLRQRGLAHDLVIVHGGSHGFALDAAGMDLRQEVSTFLGRCFKLPAK